MLNDLLTRKEEIDFIDKILRSSNNLTIGLQGAWGSGKSYLLSLFQEDKKDDYLFIRYDAWKEDFYEEPLISMLYSISNSLNGFNSDANTIKGLKRDIIDKAKEGILKLLGDLSTKYLGFNVIGTAEEIIKCIKKCKESQELSLTFNKNLDIEKILQQAREILTQICANVDVVLIVDEIDRCAPSYSLKVLERVHHFTEGILGIRTIIAYDPRILSNSLRVFYGFSQQDFDIDSCEKKYFDVKVRVKAGIPNGKFDEIFPDYSKKFSPPSLLIARKDEIDSFKKKISASCNIRTLSKAVEKASLVHELVKEEEEKYDPLIQCLELTVSILSIVSNGDRGIFEKCFKDRMRPMVGYGYSIPSDKRMSFICDGIDSVRGTISSTSALKTTVFFDVKDFWTMVWFILCSCYNWLNPSNIQQFDVSFEKTKELAIKTKTYMIKFTNVCFNQIV